jgi:hypothetical protein
MLRKDNNQTTGSEAPTGNIYEKLGEEQPPETIPPPLPPPPPQIEIPDETEYKGPEDPPPTTIYTADSDYGFHSDQVVELARGSLDFLAGLATPSTFKYLFPPVYIAVWQWLLTYVHKTRDFSQLALGLPRGFAKTTVVKLFVLYTILYTDRKFIAVMCENEKKAVNIVSDVIDMLTEANIIKVFGDWRTGVDTDQQALKKFGFRGRNIIIWAGTVETIRGITLKNVRPDIMIFDDIQSRKDADSQTVSDDLEREMYGTAMKSKSPEGCLYIFVGNMYPTKFSILRHLKTNPNWIKFITGGILADGTSLWEDLQPIEQLHREFQNDLMAGHPEIFYAEVLNDENATANNTIDISKIPPYRFSDTDIPGGRFLVIDPSGDKATSDAVSIGYFEVHDGYPVMRECIEGRLSPGDTIRQALTLCFKHGVSIVAIESNAFQYSLLYWFTFITTQMGVVGIEPVEVYSGSAAKNSRILGMFLQLLRGEVWVHPSCTPAFYLQVTQFNPLVRSNTDGLLDLVTYAPKVLELYAPQILASNIIAEQEYGSLKVIEDNFAF